MLSNENGLTTLEGRNDRDGTSTCIDVSPLEQAFALHFRQLTLLMTSLLPLSLRSLKPCLLPFPAQAGRVCGAVLINFAIPFLLPLSSLDTSPPFRIPSLTLGQEQTMSEQEEGVEWMYHPH